MLLPEIVSKIMKIEERERVILRGCRQKRRKGKLTVGERSSIGLLRLFLLVIKSQRYKKIERGHIGRVDLKVFDNIKRE